jgi:hypothetical protein
MTLLYMALRKASPLETPPYNNMPLLPISVVFQPADLARITDWIKNGAQNN